jgi:hypothetical protein
MMVKAHTDPYLRVVGAIGILLLRTPTPTLPRKGGGRKKDNDANPNSG